VNFCYFTQPFRHRKFWGYLLICQNAEGVHGQRKVGKPCTAQCTHLQWSPRNILSNLTSLKSY